MRPCFLRTVALLLVLASSSCGTDEKDRTTGGAATGAATGATIGLLGGPIGVVLGAVVGSGAGATTGAVTNPNDINLGPPPWGGEASAVR